jgi:UDP-N-acetylglucosamine:LPS N-acetylglucosamine transferase
MRRIVIVYFDAGGGHRAAARALMDSIRQQGYPWQVVALNLDDVLEPIDPIHRATGVRGGELYNRALRMGWTAGSAHVLPVMHGVIRMLHSSQLRLLRDCWQRLQPDLVVSVVPHFNRALFESLRAEAPGTPFVTVITDLADYPPHFWFESQDQDFICGSEQAGQQARALGVGPGRIWRVSGMVLHPRFYDPIQADRASERRKLGLHPALPAGLVLFGGYGSHLMLEIARRLAASPRRIQLVFLCGRNQALAKRLRALDLPFPAHVEGFTEDVVRFMWLSDFFIGKPGPGSVSEALAMRLPVIVHAGARTLAQERYNIEWIRQQGVGIPVRSVRAVPRALDELLRPVVRRRMLRNIARLNNRAVFEVPEILRRILSERAGAPKTLPLRDVSSKFDTCDIAV